MGINATFAQDVSLCLHQSDYESKIDYIEAMKGIRVCIRGDPSLQRIKMTPLSLFEGHFPLSLFV